MPPLKALVFDAYGTLFDVQSVGVLADSFFPGKGAALALAWRSKQLEYSWLRSLMLNYEDFATVTRSGLQAACRILDLPLDAARTADLMAAYDTLLVYPDARAALPRLARFKLSILSNGSPAMLGAVVRNAGLNGTFSAVISVDEARTYKPSPAVYQLAPDRLGLSRSEIGFVSSNYWDAAGAKHFGFTVFWINRSGAPPDDLDSRPDMVLGNLGELAARLDGQ